jgi:hypothetical protein
VWPGEGKKQDDWESRQNDGYGKGKATMNNKMQVSQTASNDRVTDDRYKD